MAGGHRTCLGKWSGGQCPFSPWSVGSATSCFLFLPASVIFVRQFGRLPGGLSRESSRIWVERCGGDQRVRTCEPSGSPQMCALFSEELLALPQCPFTYYTGRALWSCHTLHVHRLVAVVCTVCGVEGGWSTCPEVSLLLLMGLV